ncbi:MAG TPA: hypothetical protein VK635_27080 [Bradyrhizobium sp.]|nr:hypothetical protein [Bradyrhizobium sp.]
MAATPAAQRRRIPSAGRLCDPDSSRTIDLAAGVRVEDDGGLEA